MVFCLHPKNFTVGEALVEMQKKMDTIPTHVYKMQHGWEALARCKAELKPGEFGSEQDYQVHCSS
jgi:hypothetical protein